MAKRETVAGILTGLLRRSCEAAGLRWDGPWSVVGQVVIEEETGSLRLIAVLTPEEGRGVVGAVEPLGLVN